MGPGYDGGLYHLPHQNLIKHEKIIFGLGNIRRFGFGSINEYISSLLWVKENLILLKFIQGTYFLIFFCFIIENVKKLNINIKIILPIIFYYHSCKDTLHLHILLLISLLLFFTY